MTEEEFSQKTNHFFEFLSDTWNAVSDLDEIYTWIKQKLKNIDQNRNLILHYHLVVENLINQVLEYHIPEYGKRDLRLRFVQKLGLLPVDNKKYRIYIKGIKELNTIRNKYAHQLDYELTEESIPIISNLLKGESNDKKTAIKKIHEFTKLVLLTLLIHTEDWENKYESYFEKYPKFKIWFDQVEMDDQPFSHW